MGNAYLPADERRTAQMVDAAQSSPARRDQITLEKGVVLKIKAINPLVMRRLEASFLKLKPKVPTVEIIDPETNKIVQEPAYTHPDYLNALEMYEQEVEARRIDAMLIMGTSLIEVPEGVPHYENEEWVQNLEFILGESLDFVNTKERYLTWLKYEAMSTGDDLQNLIDMLLRKVGISEEDVAEQLATFRDNETR